MKYDPMSGLTDEAISFGECGLRELRAKHPDLPVDMLEMADRLYWAVYSAKVYEGYTELVSGLRERVDEAESVAVGYLPLPGESQVPKKRGG